MAEENGPEDCPIERAMRIIGSRTSMLVIREAFTGVSRFDDFTAALGVSPATVTAKLNALVDAGILKRQAYREPGSRTRQEYVLDEAGLELAPIVLGLYQWGRRHAGGRSPRRALHEACGEEVDVGMRCSGGHDVGCDELDIRKA
ncbi:winged helix-turn-helix transcriptional regulator [Salininema proteolyticum]|uniref:Winged helix-turn-helix transcriptional regulator n=1 Tax=Salininema proteolyticum TaxID=1607685 RepID=A0ABV8U261_9ACTN